MSSHSETTNHYKDKTRTLLQDMPSYVKDFVREIHNDTSERTQYEYVLDIRHLLEYLAVGKELTSITPQRLDDLTKSDFEEYFEKLEHYSQNGKDAYNGRTSIKRKMSAVRNFFDYMYQEGQIQNNEIRKIPMPKIADKPVVFMDSDEVKRLIKLIKTGDGLSRKQQDYNKIQSTRDLALIFTLLSTGIRVSECAEIDVDDVNMSDASIRIVRKGGDAVLVYFSDEASSYLADWLDYRKNIKGIDDETALFLSSQKRRISVRAIQNLVHKYSVRIAPQKNITPHKLRATYATQLYEATGDIYLVAENLGHKDVQTTKKHYANISNAHKEKSRNIVSYDSD